MKSKLYLYLKRFFIISLVMLIIPAVTLIVIGQKVKYNRNFTINSENLSNEGPFILYENDSTVTINYLQGNEAGGYSCKKELLDTITQARVYYFPDSSSFQVTIDPNKKFQHEQSIYPHAEKILALSDIEGSFRSFRKLLISNQVVDDQLNWTFGKGHLVLVGDFVDRGYFVTQVLLLIYKLDQQALAAGGKVHYILGNHELMNMEGDHHDAVGKYWYSASALGLRHYQLYDRERTLIGRWMNNKNVIEQIGDYIFTHGGLHPEFSGAGLTIPQINKEVRARYGQVYYPDTVLSRAHADLLFNTEKCLYWYRGYFKDNLATESIDRLLTCFNAKKIVVGHTIQNHINTLHDGRIVALDVQHPTEQWGSYFPAAQAEALLIENGNLFRVNEHGEKNQLE